MFKRIPPLPSYLLLEFSSLAHKNALYRSDEGGLSCYDSKDKPRFTKRLPSLRIQIGQSSSDKFEKRALYLEDRK